MDLESRDFGALYCGGCAKRPAVGRPLGAVFAEAYCCGPDDNDWGAACARSYNSAKSSFGVWVDGSVEYKNRTLASEWFEGESVGAGSNGAIRYGDIYQRLLANSIPANESANACWVWTGAFRGSRREYGQINVRRNGKHVSMTAHRAMEMYFNADLTSGETLDHLCRVTLCINPDHWEVTSRAVNSKRMQEARCNGR